MRDHEELRPYIDHLLAEHRQLEKLLRDARAALVRSVGPDGASFAEVVPDLTRLRERLQHHFALEEQGGLLEEVVSRSSGRPETVQNIKAEHAQLLSKLDGMIQRAAKSPANIRSQMALQSEIRELFDQMRAHERGESELLQQVKAMSNL